MGEYFDWVNVDKRELICPAAFGRGNKYHETVHKDSVLPFVLHTLLDERWVEDHVLLLSDECHVPEDPHNYIYDLLQEQQISLIVSFIIYVRVLLHLGIG